MVGEKIRDARVAQGRSLADVAAKAEISVATLSRIENEKQSLDVELFLTLARLLHVEPETFFAEPDGASRNGDGVSRLSRMIIALDAEERTELWRTLAADRRSHRPRRGQSVSTSRQVDELLAQIEFIREELKAVRGKIRPAKAEPGERAVRRR
ncbi:MAG TPA: helix-turn-helix transcriptional regulator [Thermoanaerobaculia bacterium]|nr:helix-turn-helix transcriptional regulator [Thermoanaerobaculia bacterium]